MEELFILFMFYTPNYEHRITTEIEAQGQLIFLGVIFVFLVFMQCNKLWDNYLYKKKRKEFYAQPEVIKHEKEMIERDKIEKGKRTGFIGVNKG